MINYLKKLYQDQRGIGVVEIILILVILIALVILFRDQIYSLVSNIFTNINEGSDSILSVKPTV